MRFDRMDWATLGLALLGLAGYVLVVLSFG